MSSKIGHRAIIEETVAILLVSDEEDPVLGLGGGTRVSSSRELVTAVLDLGAKQTIMLQLALSKELVLMVSTVLNTLGDCITCPLH